MNPSIRMVIVADIKLLEGEMMHKRRVLQKG